MSVHNNGHKPPIPFSTRPSADVPIIGQPMTLKAWLLQLLVTCNCSPQPEPVLIIGQIGALSQPCPKCHRQFLLQSIGADAAGRLLLNVGAVVADANDGAPPADPPGAPA